MTNEISQNNDEFPYLLYNSKGPYNPNDNCFIDSVIAAMFMFTLSPFFLMEGDNDYCKELKNILCDIYNNEDMTTSKFRQQHCPQELKEGQQDASEFLSTVLDNIQFKPPLMTIAKQNAYYNTKTNNFYTSELLSENVNFISINAEEKENHNPITKWLKEGTVSQFDEENEPIINNITYNVQYTSNSIISADCLIFNIIRYNLEGKKLTTKINTPSTIEINGVIYFRTAVVCHNSGETDIGSGHYVTLFWDGNEEGYYKYDDTNNSKLLRENVVKKTSYEEEINRDGVLFFYYIWYR